MEEQKIAFYGSHGDVKRTSAIFYYRRDHQFQTTLTLMNYWRAKRDIAIRLQATLRNLNGKEIKRETLNFAQGQVINYCPATPTMAFEGSVEIEGFADVNMVIPYAAIMAVYEAKDSISLTHSYARSYIDEEVTAGRTITRGEEGCWTIRDDSECRSFAIFHNGAEAQHEQNVRLQVLNAEGGTQSVSWRLPALPPFATVKIFPQDHVENLIEFLQGKEGSARLFFQLNRGFTRMLVGNEKGQFSDMQTAHSNFNYSSKLQDNLNSPDANAVMLLPDLHVGHQRVLLYPDYAPGTYVIQKDGQPEQILFDRKRRLIAVESDNSKLVIRRSDGKLPNRFVTGFVSEYQLGKLPVEVSRGIRHEAEPPKRFWWGPCVWRTDLHSRIVLNPYLQFGEGDPQGLAVFKLYSSTSHEVLTKTYEQFPVDLFQRGVDIEAIFGDVTEDFLGGNYGYFTFFSHFTMFDCLIIMEYEREKLAMEHGF